MGKCQVGAELPISRKTVSQLVVSGSGRGEHDTVLVCVDRSRPDWRDTGMASGVYGNQTDVFSDSVSVQDLDYYRALLSGLLFARSIGYVHVLWIITMDYPGAGLLRGRCCDYSVCFV